MLGAIDRTLRQYVNRDSAAWYFLRRSKHLALRGWWLLKPSYRRLTRNSIFWENAEMGMCSLFPEKTLHKVLELLAPRSVLDLGCGTGKSLDFFVEHGVDALGVEGSTLAISLARNKERIIPFNLNEELNLGRRFDLVWSFEVVEHIHPNYVHNLIRSFSNHANTVVMSAAQPGQGGEGHFNEQPLSYWVERFATVGYVQDVELTNQFHTLKEVLCNNILVLRKAL